MEWSDTPLGKIYHNYIKGGKRYIIPSSPQVSMNSD